MLLEFLVLKSQIHVTIDCNLTKKNGEKIEIFNKFQDIDTFQGVAKVFDKQAMKKEIVDSNIFFYYAVKVLINDCIIPILNLPIGTCYFGYLVNIR